MAYCTTCGAELRDEAEVCPNCGVGQAPGAKAADRNHADGEKYCVECGELIHERAEICPECGVRQPSYGQTAGSHDSDKIVAGILALLLGSLGAHKFYQGHILYGVLYLCFFWTGIPGLLGIIEGILMLVADDDVYAEKYADGSILGAL
ncbi:Double zinc ribbon [Natronorubrum sediminis]|uniref:Double zinc ribbon n=1 Tax=Natronorubrum sediminis TaxID=640943 RepID=A0A1H6FND6_9EURY|nr:NINE protein [Natronorubrum sediminis]SEH12396.1 Double zinc ribbon [Natronorubrum sediminis]